MHPKANQEAAKKILYEMDMLDYCIGRAARIDNKTLWQERSLILEGFLLHARVITEFLVKDPKFPDDDVSTRNFFDDSSLWEDESEALCPFLSEQNNWARLNKMLAHLSYERIEYEKNNQKKWELRQIHSETHAAFKQFVASLPEDRKGWFQSA